MRILDVMSLVVGRSHFTLVLNFHRLYAELTFIFYLIII